MANFYERYIATMGGAAETKAYKRFWKAYREKEPVAYATLLSELPSGTRITGKPTALAERLGLDVLELGAFVDGIQTSLREELDLEGLRDDETLILDVDPELLYYNMVDSKAPQLYELEEWNDLLAESERTQIRARWREDMNKKQAVAVHPDVGRNDPCPCGSGKKYKKCCWAKDHAAPAGPAAE